MQITMDQVGQETQVGPMTADGLVKLLVGLGVKNPKVILAFGDGDTPNTWKVHVFFNSPTPLEQANLAVQTVLRDTKVMAQGQEVIRTVYPDGYIGWCGKINGVGIWIT